MIGLVFHLEIKSQLISNYYSICYVVSQANLCYFCSSLYDRQAFRELGYGHAPCAMRQSLIFK